MCVQPLSQSFCGSFNPFTFKVIIYIYDPITIFLIALGLSCVGLFLLLCFLSGEVPLAFIVKLVWWCWILLTFACLFDFFIISESFPGGSDGKESTCNAEDLGSISGSGRSPGEGNGNPLQYSCLGNPMDRGAWWAIVHEVTKSQTQLTNTSTFHIWTRVLLGRVFLIVVLPFHHLNISCLSFLL